MAKRSLLTTQYHGYLAVVAALDAEWSRQNRCDPNVPWDTSFLSAIREIETYCSKQRRGLEDRFKELCDADPSTRNAHERKIGGVRAPHQFPDHLFRPVSFVPFGHSDVVSIILIDEFDIANEFAASFSGTIEEVSLGSCPILSGTKDEPWLVSPAEFLRNYPEPQPGDPPGGSAPLLSFTRIKLDAFGLLGEGLLFQEAFLQAARAKITSTLAALTSGAGYDPDQVGKVRACFLDLFGHEEIGLLIGCQDFTLAAALSAAVSGIRYEDVYGAAKSTAGVDLADLLKRRLHVESLHEEWARMFNGKGLDHPAAPPANHAVRWTVSLLGIHTDAFRALGGAEPPHVAPLVFGKVRAETRVQIMPGHHESFAPRPVAPAPRPPRWVGMGSYDAILEDAPGTAPDPSGTPTSVLVRRICRRLLDEGGGIRALPGNGDAPGSGNARNAAELATYLLVPVPDLDEIFPAVGDGHATLLATVLPQVRRRIGDIVPIPKQGEPERSFHPLSLAVLRRSMQDCGFPVSQRRSIEFLFQNYISLACNPFLFDSVIDLFDPVSALYVTLTAHFPASLPSQDEGRKTVRSCQVKAIADYVDALHVAMEQRLFRAYPEAASRQMSVDFRAGFTQLLFTANAPVVCVLGLWRRFVRDIETHPGGQGTTPSTPDWERNRMDGRAGFFPSIGFSPSVQGTFKQTGTDHLSKIGTIETDLPHLFHLPSLSDLVHESFHFVIDYFMAADTELSSFRRAQSRDPVASQDQDDLEEIFVHVLFFLIVCRGREDIFLCHGLTAYSTSVRRVGDEPDAGWRANAARQFLVVARRLSAAVVLGQSMKSASVDEFGNRYFHQGSAAETFTKHLLRYGHLVRGFDGFREELAPKESGIDFPEVCRNRFSAAYVGLCDSAGDSPFRNRFRALFRRVHQFHDFYRESLRDHHDTSGGPGEPRTIEDPRLEEVEDDLDAAVAESLGTGRPLSVGLYESRAEGGSRLDSMMMVCAVLRGYLLRGVDYVTPDADGVVRECHLPRRSRVPGKTEIRQFPVPARGETPKRYHPFLLHPSSVSRSCYIPGKRKERVRAQLAALKSLWDVSARLKGKRLASLIHHSLRGFPSAPPPDLEAILSYNHLDVRTVGLVWQLLSEAGKVVWFDRDGLSGGDPWTTVFLENLNRCRTGVVLVGPNGLGNAQKREVQWMKDRGESFRIIVVQLQDARAENSPEIPSGLTRYRWKPGGKTGVDYATLNALIRDLDLIPEKPGMPAD